MKKKELTGWHVLFMLLAFFGVLIAVNVYFTVMAVTSFRGEDVKKSYLQGLEYNQTIAARDAQKALGWNVTANVFDDSAATQLIVKFSDSQNRAIEGLSIDGVLRHPTDLGLDKTVSFTPKGDGRYLANIGPITGQWQLRATASKGEASFLFEHDIVSD